MSSVSSSTYWFRSWIGNGIDLVMECVCVCEGGGGTHRSGNGVHQFPGDVPAGSCGDGLRGSRKLSYHSLQTCTAKGEAIKTNE